MVVLFVQLDNLLDFLDVVQLALVLFVIIVDFKQALQLYQKLQRWEDKHGRDHNLHHDHCLPAHVHQTCRVIG